MWFGKGAIQESTSYGVDLVQIFKPVTRLSTMLPNAERTSEIVRRALRTALSGRRGPVHLDLPADIMKQEVTYVSIPPEHYRAYSPRPTARWWRSAATAPSP